jgi:hypothetical protein
MFRSHLVGWPSFVYHWETIVPNWTPTYTTRKHSQPGESSIVHRESKQEDSDRDRHHLTAIYFHICHVLARGKRRLQSAEGRGIPRLSRLWREKRHCGSLGAKTQRGSPASKEAPVKKTIDLRQGSVKMDLGVMVSRSGPRSERLVPERDAWTRAGNNGASHGESGRKPHDIEGQNTSPYF